MPNVAQAIAHDIEDALARDQLDLPSLPEVALQVRDEAASETVNTNSLSKVVGQDAGLAAQVVRIANSPLFRATRSIDDLSQAISRLGVEYSANLVTGLAMQQMFQATSEMVDHKMRQVWQESTTVAAWASVIAKQRTKLRADQATLAGLTHAIGVLPILGWVEENSHVIGDSLTLDRVIDAIHPTLGGMILKHWNFADEIVCVPTVMQDLSREDGPVDYADVVLAGKLCSLRNTNHPLLDHDWANAPLFKRLAFSLDEEDADFQNVLEAVQEMGNVFA